MLSMDIQKHGVAARLKNKICFTEEHYVVQSLDDSWKHILC